MSHEIQKVTCQNHNISKHCQGEFTIEPDDFVFYDKIKVPPPTFCPECRMIRRFNFRNERFLFRRPDAKTGLEIFSTFPAESKVAVYQNSFWFGDLWDPFVFGFDYDFSKNFFEQFAHLLSIAPIPARSVFDMVNSDYCNEASGCKNAYLCFNTDYVEDSAYARKVRNLKNSFDIYEADESELCYESLTLEKCYRTFYSQECESCVDVWFSKRLRGCTNCFGCVNLVNKSNCFFNEQLSKEEYSERIKNFNSGSYHKILEYKKKAEDFWLNHPVKYNHSISVINATGDRLYNSRNLKECYYTKDAENLKYCQDIWAKTNNCYDYSVWGDGAENIYEAMTCGMGIFNLKFCFNCWEGSRDLDYCGYCVGSNNCFGCVGLYKKQYCIFNKQYSKEEYFIMVEKIKKHMNEMPYIDKKGRVYKYGEFFPFELAPLSYNESLSNDFFPLSKDEILEKGYLYRDIKIKEFDKTILTKDIPDDIQDIQDAFTKEVLECEDCNRAFKIIPIEFQFYERIKLPIPRKCYDCRFVNRFKFVNPPKFYHRKCMKENCEVEFETSYAPDRPEIVYCEKCYQQEIY